GVAGVGVPPRCLEVERLGVFTPRSLDVDVILDLMIHDLQILHALDKSPVAEVRATGIPVLSPRIDIANARVALESGCVANLTASRVSAERVRKLRAFLPSRYYSLDYQAQEIRGYRLEVGAAGDRAGRPAGRASRAAGPGAGGVPRRLPGRGGAVGRRPAGAAGASDGARRGGGGEGVALAPPSSALPP